MAKYTPGDYIKVEFPDEVTGVGEWMWVRVTSCDNTKRLTGFPQASISAQAEASAQEKSSVATRLTSAAGTVAAARGSSSWFRTRERIGMHVLGQLGLYASQNSTLACLISFTRLTTSTRNMHPLSSSAR